MVFPSRVEKKGLQHPRGGTSLVQRLEFLSRTMRSYRTGGRHYKPTQITSRGLTATRSDENLMGIVDFCPLGISHGSPERVACPFDRRTVGSHWTPRASPSCGLSSIMRTVRGVNEVTMCKGCALRPSRRGL